MMSKMYRILGKRGRITIPYEIRQRVGFAYNDVLSFEESEDGKAVLVKREKVCDNCRSMPTAPSKEVTLYEFLNDLTAEEQMAAFKHLGRKFLFAESGAVNG